MCKRNREPDASPDGFWLPLDREHIEAARATYRVNKGMEWRVCQSIGLQVGGNVELRDNLISVLVERGIPTATISGMFGLSGRDVWKIAQSEPISLFWCLGCSRPLPVRDRRDVMRLKRALEAARKSSPGASASADLFCGACTENVLERLNERTRQDRLAQQARLQELEKMEYSEYLLTREWRARKAAALARAGYRCQVCNENGEELHVHHRVYTRRGCERPEDLVVLCRTHHALFHGVLPDAS